MADAFDLLDDAVTTDKGSITDYQTSRGELFGAGFEESFEAYNPTALLGRGMRYLDEDLKSLTGESERIDQKTAQAEIAKRGLDLKVPVGGMTRHELDTLQYLKQRELARQSTYQRPRPIGGTASMLGGALAGAAVDPINVASAFIPIVPEARYAQWLARAGEGAFARAGARAGAGAIEGTVGAAIIEPIVYAGATSEQADYGLMDSFMNVTLGGVLGGGLHSIGGAVYDRAVRPSSLRDFAPLAPDHVKRDAMQAAVAALERGDPVDVEPVFKAASEERGAPVAPAPPELAQLANLKPIRQATAVTPAGTRVPVMYAIADLDDLTTSHTPNLEANPRYPAELQPRDRSRAQSEAQITAIAAKLDPELLGEQPQAGEGAPIIDGTGIVESGNGRVIALRRVAEGNPEKWAAYQSFLESKGYNTDGVAKPVLVRVRTGDVDRAAFTREANAPAVAGLSASEQAIADARALPDGALPLHKGGDFRAVGNAPFVRAMIDSLAPSEGERAMFLRPDGSLSEDGARRIERAILARAFGDDADLITALTEASDASGIKAIGGALTDVAPLWARMRAEALAGDIEPSVDSTANVLAAVRTIRHAREQGTSLVDLIGQVDLLSGAIDPKTATWIRAMFRNDNLTQPLGRDRLAELLEFYANEARKQSAGTNLLGEAPATPDQILTARREQDRRRGTQLDLVGGRASDGGPNGSADAQARADVPGQGTGQAGAPVVGDRAGDGGALDLSKYKHPKTGQTLEEATAEALGRPQTHIIDTPERDAMRLEIAEMLYGEGAPRKGRDATLVLGPPASGKSAIAEPLAKEHGAIIIDSDDAKRLLPEFDDGYGSGAVHEESDAIARAVLETALSQGDNVLLPLVGRTPASVESRIDMLRAAGYRVRVVLMTLPIEKAAERAAARFASEGRLVNIPYVLSVGDKPAQTFAQLVEKGAADEYIRYDNDVPKGEKPRLIESRPQAVDGGKPREAAQGAGSGLSGGTDGGVRQRGGGDPAQKGQADRLAPKADRLEAAVADEADFLSIVEEFRSQGRVTEADDAALKQAADLAAWAERRAKAFEAAAGCLTAA